MNVSLNYIEFYIKDPKSTTAIRNTNPESHYFEEKAYELHTEKNLSASESGVPFSLIKLKSY
jgi:hypothetical protein